MTPINTLPPSQIKHPSVPELRFTDRHLSSSHNQHIRSSSICILSTFKVLRPDARPIGEPDWSRPVRTPQPTENTFSLQSTSSKRHYQASCVFADVDQQPRRRAEHWWNNCGSGGASRESDEGGARHTRGAKPSQTTRTERCTLRGSERIVTTEVQSVGHSQQPTSRLGGRMEME